MKITLGKNKKIYIQLNKNEALELEEVLDEHGNYAEYQKTLMFLQTLAKEIDKYPDVSYWRRCA